MHGRSPSLCRPCLPLNLHHGYHTTCSLRKAVRSPSSAIQSLYTDSQPPSPAHLTAATTFFTTHAPSKSWTATEWRKTSVHSPDSPALTPEIAFLGRSNTGKSSLLNALLAQTSPPLCRVGAKPGKTTLMHAWSLSPTSTVPGRRRVKVTDTEPKLTVLDMPGYGHGSHREWGADLTKYLTRRRQLRRAFVLINPAHGLKGSDLMTLEMLHAHGISHQVVACKCDMLKPLQVHEALLHVQEEILRHFGGQGKGSFSLITLRDILAVGALGDGRFNGKVVVEGMRGVEDVRWAVIRAAGLEEYALGLIDNTRGRQKSIGETAALTASADALEETQQQHKGRTEVRHEAVGTGMEALLAMTQPTKSSKGISPSAEPRRPRSRRQVLRGRRSRMPQS